jgi:hypothetical protein
MALSEDYEKSVKRFKGDGTGDKSGKASPGACMRYVENEFISRSIFVKAQ